jgi:predicted DNA-binding transcriptional regulator YafY
MARACYFADEIADMLGMTRDTFYRDRAKLHAQGMPPSVTLGRVRINKKLFDAWFERPRASMVPANDDTVAADARERLQRAYTAAGRGR